MAEFAAPRGTPSAGRGLRLLFVSPGWPPGRVPSGIVSSIGAIRAALAEQGAEVRVLSLSQPRSEPEEFVHSAPAPRGIAALARKAWRRILGREANRFSRLRRALESVLSSFTPDVIEVEESFGFPELVREVAGTPVVARLHGPWFLTGPQADDGDKLSFDRRVEAEGRGIRAAQGVSAPCQFVLDAVERQYGPLGARGQVIPNAIPASPEAHLWRPPESGPPTVLFVGRFDHLKGGDVCVRAFARVAAADPDVRLQFVGPDAGLRESDGSRTGFLAYARRHLSASAARRCEFLGVLPAEQVVPLRRACSVVLVPSRFETFPYVVLEAMAQGCPIVASRVGGIPEMLQDGRTALLVEAADDAVLADAVLRLLRSPSTALSYGMAGLTYCQQRFSPAATARESLAFYERVAGQPPRR